MFFRQPLQKRFRCCILTVHAEILTLKKEEKSRPMLTLICSLLAASLTYFGLSSVTFGTEHPYWTIIFTTLAFLACQIIISLLLRKASGKINMVLQAIMQETQKKIMAKQNQFMRRPLGQDQMMRELEREQNAGIDKMLEALELFKPLYLWNFMMKKQVNTMRMMFLYQKRKFDEVDALMPKCMFMDAQSICMKLARMYENKAEDKVLDKFYKSKTRRFKGDECTLIASTYAWILVKRDRIDDAVKALADAKMPSKDNPVIIKNWEMLVNGKIKHFSNSQIGDMWYALQLEKPKMQKVQQQMRYR